MDDLQKGQRGSQTNWIWSGTNQVDFPGGMKPEISLVQTPEKRSEWSPIKHISLNKNAQLLPDAVWFS